LYAERRERNNKGELTRPRINRKKSPALAFTRRFSRIIQDSKYLQVTDIKLFYP
jgi:hypothetical protein